MRDERYVGSGREFFTPTVKSMLIGEHELEWGAGSDEAGPYVAMSMPEKHDHLTGIGEITVLLYRDEAGKVVVDVTGSPDRVLWNEATFNHDTTYEEV